MAEEVNCELLDRGAELLFWNQPLPSTLLGRHLANTVERDLAEAIRWGNGVDGQAAYRGLSDT